MKVSRKLVLTILVPVLLGSAIRARAGTIDAVWNGGTGNWNVATDWTPNGVPNNGGGNSYNVTIDSGGTDLVSLNINATIASLTLGGTAGSSTLQSLANTAETLAVTGATAIKQTGNLSFANSSTVNLEGGLTIAASGQININGATIATITGSVNNSGQFNTGFSGGGNTVTVTGAFTNNTGAALQVEGSGDVVKVASLTNSGTVTIDSGGTLNLTAQPNGITDVPAGSTLTVAGTLMAGSASGLAKLTSVEGTLDLENGKTTSVTPTGGTLKVASGGTLELSGSVASTTTLSITGAVNNSGSFTTGFAGGSTNKVNVSGAFTNNAGGSLAIAQGSGSNDVVNVASLVNSGTVTIDAGGTLNLTAQPNGITDVPAGSTLTVTGSLTAGSANGLAKLTTVEGGLNLQNGKTNSVTPTGGTLTIASGGALNLSNTVVSTTTLSITGAVNNSGTFATGFAGGTNTVNVSGAFTNNAGASLAIAQASGSKDVVNVASLANSGTVTIDAGGTLNLTAQPNGITDIPAGSTLTVTGSLTAGSANGLAKLTTVEGGLNLQNGKTNSVTPTGGTLTIASSGLLNLSDTVASTTTLSITGAVNNSGTFATGFAGGTNTVNVSGAFTNNAGASLAIAQASGSKDVVNVASLANSGTVTIDAGGTLNLTAQPNGVTDIVKGSSIILDGNFAAGSTSGLAKLASVEGVLDLQNGQTTSVTPGSGTLTISSTGQINLSDGRASTTTLSITGNVTNSGSFTTGFGGGTNTVNVTAAFANNAGASLVVGDGSSTNDVVNIGTLSNSGTVDIGTANGSTGATLNLTASGTSTNAGTINVGDTTAGQTSTGTLKISASAVTLAGTGTVIMSNLAGNLITAAAPTDVLTSANTIEGSGHIGGGNMGFVNTGTVLANQSTPLIIDPSTSGFNNKGTLNVSAGDTLQITGPANSFLNYSSATKTLTGGTYLVSGTLQFGAAGNTIVTDAANITLTGSGAKIVDPLGGNIIAPLATISKGSLFDITSGANFTTQGNFTNNGTLTVGGGSKFVVKSGSNLTNFSGTTLTGGTYNVTGTLQFGAAGTSLVTNAANITLGGKNAKIVDSSSGNILTAFATNNAGATFDVTGGYNFSTAGNFTNNGSLVVGPGSKFDVNGNLTNFNGTTDTLSKGTYNVTGTLQFNGANIIANAANITLTGTSSQILNQTGGNGLANFSTNASTGKFTLGGSRTFTTAGSFSNAGTLTISKGSTFTVGANGNYAQTAGTTTVDGTLSTTGAGAIQINGGNVFGNGGNFSGNTTNGGTFNIGDRILTAGTETVTGTYTQNSGGALDIDIGGTTKGTQFDQLTITGAASLNGTLNLDLINSFVPTVGETFDILNANSVAGTFATVNGTSINSTEAFTVLYNMPTNTVTLDVVSVPGTSGVFLGRGQGVPGSATPEPSTLLLLGSGLLLTARYARRRGKLGGQRGD